MGLGPIQTCQSEPVRESDPWGLDCEETTLASRGQKRDFLGNKFNCSFLFPYIKQTKQNRSLSLHFRGIQLTLIQGVQPVGELILTSSLRSSTKKNLEWSKRSQWGQVHPEVKGHPCLPLFTFLASQFRLGLTSGLFSNQSLYSGIQQHSNRQGRRGTWTC